MAWLAGPEAYLAGPEAWLSGPEAPVLRTNDMIISDSFRVSGLDSRHSVVHGVTVALYQLFLFLIMPQD